MIQTRDERRPRVMQLSFITKSVILLPRPAQIKKSKPNLNQTTGSDSGVGCDADVFGGRGSSPSPSSSSYFASGILSLDK